MEKMRLINRLSDAIDLARQEFVKAPNLRNATQLQSLQRQREVIRRTLPKLREVA